MFVPVHADDHFPAHTCSVAASVEILTFCAGAVFRYILLLDIPQVGGPFGRPHFHYRLFCQVSNDKVRIPVQLLADCDLTVRQEYEAVHIPTAYASIFEFLIVT